MNPHLIPKINGRLGPIMKDSRIVYDPVRGKTVTWQYESAANGLYGLMALCERDRLSYDATSSSLRSRILVTATGAQGGSTDNPIDTWQLMANEIQSAVEDHPVFLSLSQDDIISIKKNANAAINGQSFTAPVVSPNQDLFNFLIRGQTTYSHGQYVLKHTANVSNGWPGYSEVTGEEMLYSGGKDGLLIKEIGSNWTYPCPFRMQAKLISVPSGPSHPGYLWSWRKLPSTETTSANNRIDINYEYWWGEWPTILYPVFTP